MSLGFIHGVMNTDNVQIAGETLDYGPCAFMDDFHPQKVFSSIDRNGRYAWGNQPGIAQWNLTRLAETLVPLLADEKDEAIRWAEEEVGGFRALFVEEFDRRFSAKLGLDGARGELLEQTMSVLTDNQVDFTLFFRRLTQVAGGAAADGLRSLFQSPEACDTWLAAWRAEVGDVSERLQQMRRANPILIPRNHRVEEAIAAGRRGDFDPMDRLVRALARPFEEQPEFAELEQAPAPEEIVHRTFCGT